jgi:hypothetical protein
MKGLIKVLLIMVLVVSGLLSACNLIGYFSSGPVGRALWREIRFKNRSEVDFKKIVPFLWDEMYFYGPYFSWDEICVGKFEVPADECLKLVHNDPVDGMNDGTMLLVFRNKGKIVHVESHSRFNGDFAPVGRTARPITPDHARFKAERGGRTITGEPWVRLRSVK